MRSSRLKTISVVVISRNEGRFLRQTVENLEETLPGDSEILVIDDGSTDGSADYLGRRRSGRTVLHRVQGYGVAKARNFGGEHARGDVLVFADAHLGLDAGWWRPLLEQVNHPGVGGCGSGDYQNAGQRPGGIRHHFQGSEAGGKVAAAQTEAACPGALFCRAAAWPCAAMCSATQASTADCCSGATSTMRFRCGCGCWVTSLSWFRTSSCVTAFASVPRSPLDGLNTFTTACGWRSCTSIPHASARWSEACGCIPVSVTL